MKPVPNSFFSSRLKINKDYRSCVKHLPTLNFKSLSSALTVNNSRNKKNQFMCLNFKISQQRLNIGYRAQNVILTSAYIIYTQTQTHTHLSGQTKIMVG